MASERAAALADDFAAANADALAFAQDCTEHEWALTVPGEGWTVGVVLHHIAEGHVHGARWLQDMARGRGRHARRRRTSTGPMPRTRCGPRRWARPRRWPCSR